MHIPRLALLLAVASVSLSAQIRVPIQKRVLSNGLTVMLVERHNAPVFSARISFKAGSADDPFGASGVAHVCEHMLFKGTKSFGLKNPADASKEQAMLEKEDAFWEAIVVEQRALADASALAFYSTCKVGLETSPTL